ncbi:hypothetical protein [Aureliella helgolandensis]|uniref:Uncharacterized protein n=1 Tax=Aureliella helgolandensis TaxID=2527968 RepID=A0A518GDQ7_9BACT|nr:hypothetical protein [Aureliella helgolandensis]QDV24408.1 hypothetical protein Q31a_27250 [Aureliella helgolandensis]QDV26723.1 hypothetical protein Q31a_51020 [Aureliella helgolandensis]
MTFEQAAALVAEVERSGRARVLTVGRFLPPHEVRPNSPWGLAVMPNKSPTGKPVVVWDRSGWLKLSPEPAPRRDAKTNAQPTLF